ncbi:hypothetical protein V6N11_071424 [Hibiscus sabdariffa]|uniref:Uncharacterized protein n=1 Tax=Hibiscus sabdariffa TaxID=183260 RepID=A0ABR2U0V9_9ROSI
MNKVVLVQDYSYAGSFDHDKWSEFFTRSLLSFEEHMLVEQLACVIRFATCATVQDRLVWKPTPNGSFSVASLYTIMVSFGLEDNPDLQSIWRLYDF